MNTARKGARIEAKSRRWLEQRGYRVIRSAASKGPVDLVAISAEHGVLSIQVKTRNWPSEAEMSALRQLLVPPGCKKLVHRWRDRCGEPDVREVRGKSL